MVVDDMNLAHRLMIYLSIMMLLAMGTGCARRTSDGAEEGAVWVVENIMEGCYAEGCFIALTLAPVLIPVGALVGAANAKLKVSKSDYDHLPEGLIADTDHPDYGPLLRGDRRDSSSAGCRPESW